MYGEYGNIRFFYEQYLRESKRREKQNELRRALRSDDQPESNEAQYGFFPAPAANHQRSEPSANAGGNRCTVRPSKLNSPPRYSPETPVAIMPRRFLLAENRTLRQKKYPEVRERSREAYCHHPANHQSQQFRQVDPGNKLRRLGEADRPTKRERPLRNKSLACA